MEITRQADPADAVFLLCDLQHRENAQGVHAGVVRRTAPSVEHVCGWVGVASETFRIVGVERLEQVAGDPAGLDVFALRDGVGLANDRVCAVAKFVFV